MAQKPSTITLKHLAAQTAEQHGLTIKQSEQMLSQFVEMTVGHLKKGERIKIGGLGILHVRERGARIGRHPATGAAIKIKPSKKVAFRASKALTEDLAKAEGGGVIDFDESDNGGSRDWP